MEAEQTPEPEKTDEAPFLPISVTTEDRFPFATNQDEAMRCFILEHMGNSEIDGKILVQNMAHVYVWIKEGKLAPEDAPKSRKPKLTTVAPDGGA